MNYFLLYSFIYGIYITFIYDVLRILRRAIRHNLFFISLEDIVFWIYCALLVFKLMHTQSNGTLRWFAVLGAVTGMLIYKKTISNFLVKWLSKGLIACGIVMKPFRFLFGKLRKTGKAVGGKACILGSSFRKMLKKKLTALKKMLRMILCKQ